MKIYIRISGRNRGQHIPYKDWPRGAAVSIDFKSVEVVPICMHLWFTAKGLRDRFDSNHKESLLHLPGNSGYEIWADHIICINIFFIDCA